jgi:hypothetical protein
MVRRIVVREEGAAHSLVMGEVVHSLLMGEAVQDERRLEVMEELPTTAHSGFSGAREVH